MSDKTTVAPMDPALQNSPLSEPVDGATTVNLEREDNQCLWNGQDTEKDIGVLEGYMSLWLLVLFASDVHWIVETEDEFGV